MDYPTKEGPSHLGLRCNALPEHHMALITSGRVPFRLLLLGKADSAFRPRVGFYGMGGLVSHLHTMASPGTQTQDTSLGVLYELVS